MKEGLEAIIFTADGDMRQALNNLQATHFGFGLVDSAAVFKVKSSCLQEYLPSDIYEYKQGHAASVVQP